MAKVILHVCDSCDARDRVDDASLSRHDIQSVRVHVFVGNTDASPKRYAEGTMLCSACRDELDTAILRTISQKPREARSEGQ